MKQFHHLTWQAGLPLVQLAAHVFTVLHVTPWQTRKELDPELTA